MVKRNPHTESFVVAVKIYCAPHSLSRESGGGEGSAQPTFEVGDTLQYLRPDGMGSRTVKVVQVIAAAAANPPVPGGGQSTDPPDPPRKEGGTILAYAVEYEVETTDGHLMAL